MGKQKLNTDKLRGGNVQRGGGVLSFIGSIPGRIYTFTMYVALFNLMIMPIGVIFLLFLLYKSANMMLFGTNWIINGLNETVIKAVKAVIRVINDIIDLINKIIP